MMNNINIWKKAYGKPTYPSVKQKKYIKQKIVLKKLYAPLWAIFHPLKSKIKLLELQEIFLNFAFS